MTPPYLREQGGEVLLSLRIQPRASQSAIGDVLGAELKVRVAAPPVDDAANEELVRFLARRLGCSRGQVRLLRGRTSRSKVIAVAGVGIGPVAAALTAEG